MLFLRPPYHMIEGVAIMPDHANERQFYYMPAMPKLTTDRDPISGVEVPRLQLLKFRGGNNIPNGGFLTFGVNLGIDQERLDSVAIELKRIQRLRDDPILAPLVLEDGAVRLMILGAESPAPVGNGGAPPGDDARFAIKISHGAKPALFGDNNAVFSVELDQHGVELVEASLLGNTMPIGVVYSLDFLALRPAYSVKVTADWNRVQTHFQESFSVDVLFASTEIDKVIDKLIEDQVILIEVDTFLPEGEDTGSWVGRRDQAINDFKDMILDTFFTPSLEPIREEEDGWDRFVDTTERLALLAATGGWGGVVKFGYTRRDITRIDQKRLNLRMTERLTVRRSIYPQATLRGLSDTLRDANGQIDLSRFVRDVTLNDPWFTRREVTAYALANFDNDSIDSINATLWYDNIPQTIRLTKNTAEASRQWNSVVVNNEMVRPVEYEYRVNFRDVDTSERPGVLHSPRRTTDGEGFEIAPRSEGLYFLDDIQFSADLLPWDRYPRVMVEARYEDREHGILLADSFMLSKDRAEATWKRFRLSAERSEYEVRVTYLAADHHDVVLDWRTTDEERLAIRDPFPTKRTVQIVPVVSWDLVAMVLAEVKYLDGDHDVVKEQMYSFFGTTEDRGPKSFTVDLEDPSRRLVYYSATIILKDNRVINVPPSMTADSRIVLTTDATGHRVVIVRPAAVDFQSRGIARIEAGLAYKDADEGLSFEDLFTFRSSNDIQYFEYNYNGDAQTNYSCRVSILFDNGLIQELDLGLLDSDELILPTA